MFNIPNIQSDILEPILLFLGLGNITLARHLRTLRYLRVG